MHAVWYSIRQPPPEQSDQGLAMLHLQSALVLHSELHRSDESSDRQRDAAQEQQAVELCGVFAEDIRDVKQKKNSFSSSLLYPLFLKLKFSLLWKNQKKKKIENFYKLKNYEKTRAEGAKIFFSVFFR